MATLLFTAVGTLIGGPLGGAIGALAGRQVDALLIGGGNREGPRLSELSVTTSSYGMPLPRHFGTMRVAGQIIWATDLTEHSERHGGGKGKPGSTEYTYTASFAVALSSRAIIDVGRIWADGKLLRGAAGDLKTGGKLRLHRGQANQTPDPLLAAAEGSNSCPAYTGLAYAVFEDLQLGDFGNRIPALTFEIVADTTTLTVAELFADAVDEVDAAVPLTGITGLSCEGPLIDALGALDPIFPMDCDACDGKLTIRPDRQQITPVILNEAATSTEREDFGGNAGFSRKRSPSSEQPVSVLRYYDIDRDYQPGAQRASGQPLSGQPRTAELPAAMSAGAARSLVEQAAKRSQWARQSISWRTCELDPAVRPGATVILPDAPGLWRVREWEWRSQGIDLSLVRLSPSGSNALSSDPGRSNPAPDAALSATTLTVTELPWDGYPASPVPLLLASVSSTSSAWPGASLYADRGDGALIPLGPSGRARAVTGVTVDILAPASPLIFDRHRSVKVDLSGADMTLSDATMLQLAMGANRAVLGNEIIQFARAEPLGACRWRLSGLWRGQGGTERGIVSHAAGEPFVLLDGAGVVLDSEAIGQVPETRIAAIGLGDPNPIYSTIHLRGIGLRPPAPVHGRLVHQPDGSSQLVWTRRARGGWLWQDGVDTPLNEQVEAYEVTFGSPSATLGRWLVSSSSLALTEVDFVDLVAQAPGGTFSIRQRGDRAFSEALVVTTL